MSEFLTSRYSESVQDGALGVELFDALRATRVLAPIRVWREGPAPALADKTWPRMDKRHLDLQAVFYQKTVSSPLVLRFFDESRRYAARRLSFTFQPLATARTQRPRFRLRPVSLFAGAAYPFDSCATGVRGRVERAGQPVRWVRVEARKGTGPDTKVVGIAHGDDRGEFLLIVRPDAAPAGDLPAQVKLTVVIFAPAAPDPATYVDDPFGDEVRRTIADPRGAGGDPFGDLVVETVGAPTGTPDRLDPDPVLLGEALPTGYSQLVSRPDVVFTIGRVRTDEPKFSPP